MTPVTTDAITAADEAHLERAVALAREARERGDQPFGSVVVTPDGTVFEARNSVVTEADPTGHAETNVVRLIGRLDAAVLAGSTLYTNAEPCPMCSGAIYWSGIGRVAFALSDEQMADLITKDKEEDVPLLSLPSREVFARGGRPITLAGPAALPSAIAVHDGYWS